MLLQSQEDFMELLPALPSAWKDGEIKGLIARGNFELNIKWKNSKLVSATILAKNNGVCKIKYQSKSAIIQTKQWQIYDVMKALK